MANTRLSLNASQCVQAFLLLQILPWSLAAIPVCAGQEPAPPVVTSSKPNTGRQSRPAETPSIASDAPVITINGLCENPGTGKAVPSNCTTVITRAEFEKMVDAIQPGMKGRARREFATNYANALVMAHKAEQMGLDRGAKFEEQMKVARVQILSQEMKKLFQNEASQISDADIENYYRSNTSAFEQAEIERVYVPRAQDQPAAPGKTLNEVEKQEQLHRSEQVMRDQADQLYERAIRGEDFSRLQADAYSTAGINAAANPNMGKIRRISLPKDQVWVMDLKPGEVSSVVGSPNGYVIYKIKSKEVLSLNQVREEIRGLLKSQRLQEKMQAIQESATPALNEIYFYPPRTPQGTNNSVEHTDSH